MTTCRVLNHAILLALTAAYGLQAAGAASALPPVMAAAAAPAAAISTTPAAASPTTPEAMSYDIGIMLGSQLEHNGLTPSLSVDSLIRGLKDSLAGHTLTTEERDTALKFMRSAREALTEKNRDQGKQFLVQNAKQAGVVALPSGLQYRVLSAGDPNGKSPAPMDQVTVRYTAALADGTIFDRSDSHDQPATFRVNSVFKGWQEAFLGMKPGATWQLFVPPELGYGSNPPPSIPPGSVLVYELELLRIDPTPAMDPAAAARAAPHSAAKPAPPNAP
jgi:FKBP-type peptidyl-prolyl cis-trans isomerase FklB